MGNSLTNLNATPMSWRRQI